MAKQTETEILKAKQRKKDKRRKFLRAMFSRRIVIIGVVGTAFFLLCAIFAPVLAPYDPNTAEFAAALEGPSAAHLLGTDTYGRDVLSRLLYGSRVSLIVGVVAVMISCAIGTFIGMIAGYYGGWRDHLIMRGCEVMRAIPQTVLAMALITIIGRGIQDMAIILGITTVPGYIRMMRSQVMKERSADYITASRLQGMKMLPLMYKHILPNCISPIIVMMTQQVGATILVEAGLSFLGIGISIPTASWGSMVNDGRQFLLSHPILSIAPGVCVALLVISLNLLGDGVRDALDPRLRGSI